MPHVFISYSRKDSEFVVRLENDLNQRGIVTWRDQHAIVGGEDWYKSIVRALNDSYAVIAVVTPNSDESRWVKREALYADQIGLPILPVLPAKHGIPFHLIEIQPILCALEQYDEGLVKLVVALNALPKKTPGAGKVTPELGPLDPETVRAYLDFLLSETRADLRTALYVNLEASREQPVTRPASPATIGGLRSGLPTDLEFEPLPVEQVERDGLGKAGNSLADARAPILDMKRVVLLGEPGAGKTTTLLQLVVDLAQAARDNPGALLPVYVPLRSFKGVESFAAFVLAQMSTLQSQYGRLLADKRLILLCDALNEMPRKAADGHDLVQEVSDFLRDKPYWVVSCRVRDYEATLQELDGVGIIRLKPLNPPRIQQAIERRFHRQPGMGAALWQAVQGSDDLLAAWNAFEQAGQAETFWGKEWSDAVKIRDEKYPRWTNEGRAREAMQRDPRRMLLLCRNPYILYMVSDTFRDTHGKLPENRGALFSGFVTKLLQREEKNCADTGALWLPANIIRQALAQLAFAMQQSESGTEITRAEALTAINEHRVGMRASDSPSLYTERGLGGEVSEGPGEGVSDYDPALLLQLAASASLLDVGERVRFSHQLLQEYFASEILGAVMDAELQTLTPRPPLPQGEGEANPPQQPPVVGTRRASSAAPTPAPLPKG